MKNAFLVQEKINAIPLSEVVDTGKLIVFIEQHGIYAQLEPIDKVIPVARNEKIYNCKNRKIYNWMVALKNMKYNLML